MRYSPRYTRAAAAGFSATSPNTDTDAPRRTAPPASPRRAGHGAVLLAATLAFAACADDLPSGPDESSPPSLGVARVPVGYFASPKASSQGDGSHGRPWTLATALSGAAGRLRPGDTLWLRGGTYRGAFTSQLRGAPGRPVVVRAYPGERPVIDGAGSSSSTLRVAGDWSVFWGLEVTSSDPARSTPGRRPNTVVNEASHTRYVNLVIHDGGVAFYSPAERFDVELYGSIIYNNGWQWSDRGHGHGVYVKSNAGPIRVRDNVIFNQFGYGIHAYSNAGSGRLANIRLEGNIAFNNGTLSSNSTSANILLGGEAYASGAVVASNYAYFTPGAGGTNVRVGHKTTANGDVLLVNNRFIGGGPVLDMGFWSSADVSGNIFRGAGPMVTLHDRASGYRWNGNRHHRDAAATAWGYRGSRHPFDSWRRATGLARNDQALGGAAPRGTEVFVRPNRYERGRATVLVHNWSRQGSVAVDLGSVLAPGSRFEIRNVQRLAGAPVASGVYRGGAVSVRLDGVRPPVPTGMGSSRAPSTGTAFHVFLVTTIR